MLPKIPEESDQLKQMIFNQYEYLIDETKKLKGYNIVSNLRTLELSLKIFNDAVFSFKQTISNFLLKSDEKEIWLKNFHQIEEIDTSIQRNILTIVSSAMSLVDFSRKLKKKYKILDYECNIKNIFNVIGEHCFIQSIRNLWLHDEILKANWSIEQSSKGRNIHILLNKKELLKKTRLKKDAKEFIEKSYENIDLHEIFISYQKKVNFFNKWLRSFIYNQYSQDIEEYLKYETFIKKEGDYSSWNFIISQALKQKENPYIFLEEHFNNEEINIILAFPKHSKEQVNKIISMKDKYDICDDELRSKIYELFKCKHD